MRDTEMRISRLSLLVIFGALCLMSGACARQSASELSPPSEPSTSTVSSPEIVAAEKIIASDPDSPHGYNLLAVACIKKARETGDHSYNKKGEAAVERALAIAPDDQTSRKLHATLLAAAHEFVEARDAARALVNDFPEDAFAYGILVDANSELGNYDEALKAAQRMVDLKPNSASYSRVAHMRSLHGDHAGAVQMLTTAARTADPQDKEAQSWCLMQLSREYFKVGDLEKATKIADESLQISPNYPLALIEKARYLAAAGDLDGAEQKLRTAIAGVPLTEALIMLGDISRKRGNLDDARQQYASAEDAERAGGGDIHRFALLWADQGERLDEALEVARADYETNKDIYASDILAWCLFKKGMVKEAQAVIKKALRLKTNDARILYHAGMIEGELGNRRLAARYLASALKINPNFDLLQAEIARAELASLGRG
jgi:tetratricopeptide (TPR) repeat protein